ncbi:MAG: uracil-DNA glycosylase [Planctomycetales bacterium]|nr:uracil-DNA glycosylase [bacterium]UNM08039.1 MAG: uracil-DNA glycosylase [Planctomycetales bacterium]
MAEGKHELLERLAGQIRSCTRCPLCDGRTHAVPGEGSPNARVVFVGEAPGRDEDEQGRPFVGKSGQLLRQTIREVGWREDEVFIANVLKCRPPENRDPEESEIEACRSWLIAQLVTIRPRLIVTLGRYSMALLMKPGLKITQIHGRHAIRDGFVVLPTYHPSAVLRDPEKLADFRRDIMKARRLSEVIDDNGRLNV